MIRQIPIHELSGFLAAHGELLRRGVASMGHRVNVGDVIDLLHAGQMQLWAADDASGIVLSEVVAFPRMKVLRLFGLAGTKIRELAKLLHAIKAWGVEQGCEELEAVDTRPGLEIVIPDFHKTGVCLVMSLNAKEIAA